MREWMVRGLFLLVNTGLLVAQGSPRGSAVIEFEGQTVTIEYGRPSLKGRAVNDLLAQLPEDRVWRAGSEQVTTLHTETDLMIGDQKVPAGKYSLYVKFPADGNPLLLVNRTLGQPLGDIWDQAPPDLAREPWPHFAYEQEIAGQEAARIELAPATMSDPVDEFTIVFESGDNDAWLKLAWGDQSWSAAIAPGG